MILNYLGFERSCIILELEVFNQAVHLFPIFAKQANNWPTVHSLLQNLFYLFVHSYEFT